MIVIIDYGVGNIFSVKKAFDRLDIKSCISNERKIINKAEKLILPGVGNFKMGINNLKRSGLLNTMNDLVLNQKIPILGICLGMQLMTNYSEEGNSNGLGWIDAKVKLFNSENKINALKVPHMGWNSLSIKKPNKILNGITNKDIFYFVHSFYISCNIEKNIIASSNYGIEIISLFNKRNIFGVQFHPEKSHDKGLIILNNFANL